MSLIVQKYGGTSVANPESLKIVAEKIINAKKEDNQVVVVVSAMGSSTDELISLANELSEEPSPREMDMLLSAGERITMSLLAMHLNSLGYDSFSLTGSQAGIITTSRHGRAEIEKISGERVREGLEKGNIVIVAGFQGFNPDTREITTLGRGGSDATGAEPCTGSNNDGKSPSGLILPEGAMPIVPVQAGPRSERISPKRFEATTTSNLSGFNTKCAVKISM